MKIGVIANTNASDLNEIPGRVLSALEDVDLIVHAGNFCRQSVLDGLKTLGDIVAVSGNDDPPSLQRKLPKRKLFEINGKRIGVLHGNGGGNGSSCNLARIFENLKTDIIIFGHPCCSFNTHVKHCLMFNPGPSKDSYGIIDIGDKIEAKIMRF